MGMGAFEQVQERNSQSQTYILGLQLGVYHAYDSVFSQPSTHSPSYLAHKPGITSYRSRYTAIVTHAT